MKWVKYDENYRIPVKSWCEYVADNTMEQVMNLVNHPAVKVQVVLLPDAGYGFGMPIGCVVICDGAVIPNAVGKDISCGMRAVKTSLKRQSFYHPHLLEKIRNEIKRIVPVGFNHHKKPLENNLVTPGIIYTVTKREERNIDKQLGTLGGGNHFIEIQYDVETDDVWFMIHCGSRNFGLKICDYYNKVARNLNNKWHSKIDEKWDLAFLPIETYEAKAYLSEMKFAMEFALENRRLISENVKKSFLSVIDCEFEEDIDINHNYAEWENHFGKNYLVHRKGATRARKGEIGIIPGDMGSSSYIVEGLGNPHSFMSCSHGSGRPRSCTESSNILSVEDCNKKMEGILFDGWGVNRKGKTDLGEAPDAYKDIEEVIESELDLIKPIIKLKPLAVVKEIKTKRR